MSDEYVDCPECGMEQIPPRARICSACEVDARWAKQMAEKDAQLAARDAEIAKVAKERDEWKETAERVEKHANAGVRFKSYVHERLDAAGIPTHPEGLHSQEGCRVGDRLDLLIGERDALRVRSNLQWRVIADSQNEAGRIADTEKALDQFDKELDELCGQIVKQEDRADAAESALSVAREKCRWPEANCSCQTHRATSPSPAPDTIAVPRVDLTEIQSAITEAGLENNMIPCTKTACRSCAIRGHLNRVHHLIATMLASGGGK